MCESLQWEEKAAQAARVRPWLAVFFFVVLVVCGCGSQDQVELAPVKGVVLLEGHPLRSGSVITTPTHGRGAQGQIDATGRFTLATRGLGEGAVVGSHQVAVVAVEGPQSNTVNPEAEVKLAIPGRYAEAASSGLVIDVQPNQINEVTLQLTSTQR